MILYYPHPNVFFRSSGIDAGIFLDNYVNSTIVDAIVACVTGPFEVMVLNMQDILASALHEGGYQFIHEMINHENSLLKYILPLNGYRTTRKLPNRSGNNVGLPLVTGANGGNNQDFCLCVCCIWYLPGGSAIWFTKSAVSTFRWYYRFNANANPAYQYLERSYAFSYLERALFYYFVKINLDSTNEEMRTMKWIDV